MENRMRKFNDADKVLFGGPGAAGFWFDEATGVVKVNPASATDTADVGKVLLHDTDQTVSGFTGVGAVQVAEVSLTATQVKALRATPITLVAAPGAGKVIEFLSAVLILDATATAFTESDDNMAIKYNNGSGVAVSDTIEATGFIDQTADTMTRAVPVKDAIVAASAAANKALVLHNTGDGEYGTGTGTLKVKISFRVWDTDL